MRVARSQPTWMCGKYATNFCPHSGQVTASLLTVAAHLGQDSAGTSHRDTSSSSGVIARGKQWPQSMHRYWISIESFRLIPTSEVRLDG